MNCNRVFRRVEIKYNYVPYIPYKSTVVWGHFECITWMRFPEQEILGWDSLPISITVLTDSKQNVRGCLSVVTQESDSRFHQTGGKKAYRIARCLELWMQSQADSELRHILSCGGRKSEVIK